MHGTLVFELMIDARFRNGFGEAVGMAECG